MAKVRTIPSIVSKRNEFHPADELVEDALPHLADQFKHPDFRVWLVRYTETVIKSVASHFGIAAQRGIEQAADLLCDPGFYETRRKRRSEWNRKMKEDMAKQEWERAERQLCPTPEQIEDQIKWHERQLAYYQSEASKHEIKLQTLRTTAPRAVSAAPKSIQ
jgi:hypothetical protein